MGVTRDLIYETNRFTGTSTWLNATLEKEEGKQKWEFYLKHKTKKTEVETSWQAEGADDNSIKGVTVDAWHSLALALVAEGLEDLFPDAVRKIKTLLVNLE